jgi:hypothetical protein
MWRWLAITAIVFAFLWTLPGIADSRDALAPHTFHVVVSFALVTLLIVSGLLYGPPAVPGEIDPVSSGALATFLAAAAILVLASRHDPVALTTFLVLVVAALAIAWRTEAAAAAVPAAAVLAVLVILRWALNLNLERRVQDRTRELETSLAQVRQLGGLLPICAWCKNVRDDQDYWHSVEAYPSERTDARFSHGICPSCIEKV